jgi:preprotein translocase subunit SecY
MQELIQVINSSAEVNITQSPFLIIINLSLALVLGMIYAYVYKLTYVAGKKDKILKKEMEEIKYTLMLLAIGGAFIWIVVADNLVRAFGLAGALSLIRFRTVVKDPKNTIKLFYAIIIGMSCGLSQYYAAIIGTLFICFVLTIQYYLKLNEKRFKKEKKINDNAKV